MKLLIIGILILSIGVETFFTILRYRRLDKPPPKEASKIYDNATYQKCKSYNQEKNKVQYIEKLMLGLMLIVLHVFNMTYWLYQSVSRLINEPSLINVLTALSLSLIFLPVTIAKSVVNTFGVDARYGFNNTTIRTFIADWVAKIVLGSIVISILVTAFSYNQNDYLSLSIFLFFPVILIWRKIFHKLKPLDESPLKEKIKNYATEHKFRFKNVYVMNASKRNTRANAYFSGFGKWKKIVLYDTLINCLSEDEVLAIFAHEVGHAKHKDAIRLLPLWLPIISLILVLFRVIHQSIKVSQAFGFVNPNIVLTTLIFLSFLSLLIIFVNLIKNPYSRHIEYRADAYAAETTSKKDIINTLKHLSRNNLSNLYPHPIEVFVYYSHPTIVQRIKAIINL